MVLCVSLWWCRCVGYGVPCLRMGGVAVQRHVFPRVPLDVGVRHIHSPREFIVAHGLAAPGFEIVKTRWPQWTRDYAVLEFEYVTWFGEGCGVVFTDRWTQSMVWMADARCAGRGVLARLEVAGVGPQGYSLRVVREVFGELGPVERWAWPPVQVLSKVVEDAVGWGAMERVGANDADENVLEYRRRVLWELVRSSPRQRR
jgi:hypothetical protein